ncbi:MAG TPA: ribonuclease H-like domain-containing protein, partial [Candidatus Nanoarchaeia archaeon]|nr:ribonuclease H-like domain-containing protein [Candidatus Nanoarchaeia archaeon]
MLTESFILLDRVGSKSEQRVWEAGIQNWDHFRQARHVPGISSLRKGFYDRQLDRSEQAHRAQDIRFFASVLPMSQQWRLWEHFKDEAVFLDIETSGYYGDVTVVGLYDGYETKSMVRGITFDRALLKEELRKYKLLVTFNGRSFDVPVLQRYFKDIVPDIPHIDLRHVCAKIGLHGGLKHIERELGISRPTAVANFTGEDAVYLWQQWKATGDREYLEKLVQYNEEDIVNLKPVMEYCYKR